MREEARFIQAHNWTDCPLGAPASWPLGLRTAVELAAASRLASYVVWGVERVVIVNDAGSQIHGSRAFARSGAELFGADWHTLEPVLERVLRDGRPHRADGIGESARLDVSCLPIAGDSGAIEGVLWTCEDRAADVAIAGGARANDDLVTVLGHELRNPLAALSATVQALSIRGASPETELMERSVRHLGLLVDDLLDLSRLSRGSVRLERARAELAHVVDDAIERVQPVLDARGTSVFVHVPRAGLALDCDRHRLSQVLGNVLSNACRFSPPGASVSIEAVRTEGRVQIRVEDTGCGIEAARLPAIFDAFERGRDAPGLGIGLTIARRLVELHDGSITVHSAGPGRGTQCVIELPVRASDAPAKPGQLARRSRKRVLLVEDNHDTAVALKHALEQLGYQVALAHDGPVALTVARSFQPDVVLLDIGLPVMDGWELARRLRELRVPSRELHFVAVTARDQDADKVRSHEAGFLDHLVKPIDLAKLERVVESLPPSPERAPVA